MKSSFSLLALLLLVSLTLISARAQVAGERAYQEAEALRKQGDYRAAIARYDAALAEDADNYRFYLQKGRCQYQIGDTEAARRSLLQAIEQGEGYTPASAYYLLGKIYRDQDQEDEALRYYRTAAEKEPDRRRRSQYQLLLVQSLIRDEAYKEAANFLDQAEQLNPDDVRMLYYQAELAAARENWPRAQQYYEQALRTTELREASPEKRAQYYFGLGLVLTRQGKTEEAQKAFKEANFGRYKSLVARYMAQTNPGYYYRLAVSYYVNEEYATSESYIQELLMVDPNYANAWVLRARIAERNHRFAEATSHYQKAVTLESDTTDRARILMQLAELHLSNDNPSAALQAVEAAAQADYRSLGSTKLIYVKARSEYLSGRHAEAVNTFERLLSGKLDTRSEARYSFMQGMAAKKAGDMAKAKTCFESALFGPYKPAAEIELEELKDAVVRKDR
jgi:tetratricopeptide (TPR) repeat protein